MPHPRLQTKSYDTKCMLKACCCWNRSRQASKTVCSRCTAPPTPRNDVLSSSDAAVPSCAPASAFGPSTPGRKTCCDWPGLGKCPDLLPLRLCSDIRCGAVQASAVAAAARQVSSQRIPRHSRGVSPAARRQLRLESPFDPTRDVEMRHHGHLIAAQAVP